ncbi:carboxypeptidase-like regulatory domain-containing protein [uncultured Dokdonia sp.]|uniref:carboxypeptidase-like regulatory domain-containing protein n=1 Tax=uncultured Dokdonia sp. TaxID=575653 RepID=UPI0026087DD7|nr:carboxypeptidase-like regulatory domain-containing protein [uncultured Dokdonia sp.]
MKRLLLLIISTVAFSGLGQEVTTLTGTVLNDTIGVSQLNIVNLTLKRGATTNANGVFEIPVRVHDIINISAVQYESRQIVVTPVIYGRGKISFYLEPKVNELDEVVVSNITLTGDLSKDLNAVPLQVFIDPRDLGIPANARPTMTAEERRFYGATGGAGPLGSLINAITGRTKMLKKQLEISKFRALVEGNRDNFNDSMYIKSLNIPDELILDFVYYVFEDEQAEAIANEGNTLGLLDFMLTKSPVYLKLKAAESVLPKNDENNE